MRSPVEEEGHFIAQLPTRLRSSRWTGIMRLEASSTQGASFTLGTMGLPGRLVADTVALRTKLAEYFPGEGTDKVPKPLQVQVDGKRQAQTD